MGIILAFMLTSTLTPFFFLQLRKKSFAIVQTILLIGMWVYFFQAAFQTAPPVLSVTSIMFYASLVMAEVGWIMFIIHHVKTASNNQQAYI
ncbi:hypothetical protein GCM10008983_03010 [Lentibacillus halophilus]|uniref:Uncharacterized protein n=1 Tax=Lentibacillus halophilus TaxID=295065 RepID=A0ABP3IW21_9BACI